MQLKKIIGYLSAKPQYESQGSSFSNKLLTAQRKAADYLNKKTAGWSPAKMKVLLTLFCLIWANIILLIAGRAILSANGPPGAIPVQRLFMPPLSPVPGHTGQQRVDTLPKKINH